MDVILQQSLVYGGVATLLLSPSLPKLLPPKAANWLRFMKRPVLVAMILYLFYIPASAPRNNYYTLLEVDIHASKNDIVQGYRTISKRYHPDKVAVSGITIPEHEDMTPEEFFMRIKKAQDILTHDSRKSAYDRFGDIPPVIDVDEKVGISTLCLSIAAYLILFCVGFGVSYFNHVLFSRQIFLVYLASAFCVELQQRFVEDDSFNFLPFVKNLLPFEKVQLLRSLFPCALVSSLCIATWQYADITGHQLALLKALLSVNRVLTERMQEAIRATTYLKSLGTPSVAALKASVTQQQNLQSAALRVKTGGTNVGGSTLENGPSTKGSSVSNAMPAESSSNTKGDDNQKKSDWDKFSGSLTEEQMELFKSIVAAQYRISEAEEKQRRRLDINWGQMLMWACILFLWIYYK